MPVIQIKERKSTNQLEDLLKTLYEDVLLLSENDEVKLRNNTRDKRWKQFVKSGQVQLVYNHEEETGKFVFYKNVLTIESNYSEENISDTIIFTNIRNKVFFSLFSHIRNAFAHNQIFVEGEYITMYDRLTQQSSAFTMIAHVKIEALKELIKTIKDIKK